jgi:endonuclease/exonuclease/phosphatase family metal-dependent hydrolase
MYKWLLSLFLGVLIIVPTIEIFAQQPTLQTIAEARRATLGTVVRVAGRVSSAAELGTTSYLQDGTGGLAVFNTSFTSGTAIGDSVEITGPLSEFQATTGVVGSGLLQISGTSTTWRRITTATRIAPMPRIITLREIAENIESTVIRVNNVQFVDTGVFRGNTNYVISDGSTTAQVRISNGTNLVNTAIPRGTLAVTGLLGQFRGTYQITPRFLNEIGGQITTNPFDTIPKSQTLDITTWNVRWFGRPRDNDGVTVLGPADSLLQLRNVIRVLDSIDADIYGIQEVSNSALFRRIQDSLPRYGVVIAEGIQPAQPQFVVQRTAFVFKRSELDTLRTRLLLTNSQFAAGRFPFLMEARLRSPLGQRVITFVVIHAKAGSTQRDYDLRTMDAQLLYNDLLPLARQGNIVLLGDFNDALTTSIFNALPTPYNIFVNDTANFISATQPLSRQGLSSFATGGAVIDNIITSRSLGNALIRGAEKIENTSFISNYVNTTTDHYPVTVRMFPERVNMTTNVQQRYSTQNVSVLNAAAFPNPSAQHVALRFSLPEATLVRLSVMNMLGQEQILIPETMMQNGEQNALLDVSSLPSGLYQCRIQASGQQAHVKIMVAR